MKNILWIGLIIGAFGVGWYLPSNVSDDSAQPSSAQVNDQPSSSTTGGFHDIIFKDFRAQFALDEDTIIGRSMEGEGGPAINYELFTASSEKQVYDATKVQIWVSTVFEPEGDQEELEKIFAESQAQSFESGTGDLFEVQKTTINGLDWVIYGVGGICEGKDAKTVNNSYEVTVTEYCGDKELFQKTLGSFVIE